MNKHPSTLINIHKLSNDLSFHPNLCFVNFLISGFTQSFLAGLNFIQFFICVCKDLSPSLKEPEVVDTLIQNKLAKGI